MIRLVRGRARVSDLSAALDELQIGDGEEFIVCRPESLPELETNARARGSDPDTSKAGAKDVVPRAKNQYARILKAMAERQDPLSYDQIEAATGIIGCWKRLTELRRYGWIAETGERVVPTTGSAAHTYALTDKAWEWLRANRPEYRNLPAALFASTEQPGNAALQDWEG